MNQETLRKLGFFIVFIVLGFLALHIPIAKLEGSKAAFTLFDAFGPIAGAFIGTIPGALSVLLMQGVNFFINGANFSDAGTVIRLLPMVFAAYYFGAKKKGFADVSVFIPAIAILLFILHPVGRQVWYYSLFWTIPIIARLFPDRLFIRSLGSTFAAHSVGGAIWVWTVSMTPHMWIALIPVVIFERLLFALGITVSFVASNTLLAKVESSVPLVSVDKRYIFSRKLLQHI